jgi:recombination protein RecA
MEDWIKDLHKKVGGNDNAQSVMGWLSTGYLPLNYAMGGSYMGGFPVGRISEVYGGPSSGKTLMATMAMIETQKRNGFAVFLDYEHAFDIQRGADLGLDVVTPERWLFKKPGSAEEGLGLIQKICNSVKELKSKTHVTIVVDSVAAMKTKEEIEAGFDKSNMKTKLSLATVMSLGLKQVIDVVEESNVTLIFLNQVRVNPGVMFGDNETTPGGNALEFYASLRMRLQKGAKVFEKPSDRTSPVIGEIIRARMVKNKVFRPFQTAEWTSDFTYGVELDVSHINALIEMGKLQKSSSGRIEIEGKKLTITQLATWMKGDPKIREIIIKEFI